MELRCQLCGKTTTVAKWHPDYERLRSAEAPAQPYICEACARRVQADANRHNRPSRPL